MPIKKRITSKKRLVSRNMGEAINWLKNFTPEKPLMVSQVMYDEMAKQPELEDYMDRAKVYPIIPRVDE